MIRAIRRMEYAPALMVTYTDGSQQYFPSVRPRREGGVLLRRGKSGEGDACAGADDDSLDDGRKSK